MRPWKAVLGLGAACAACCALPLVGSAAAWMIGTTALAAISAALLACVDELAPLAPLALGLLAVALVVAGVIGWRRWARAARSASADVPPACTLSDDPAPAARACTCAPGACQ